MDTLFPPSEPSPSSTDASGSDSSIFRGLSPGTFAAGVDLSAPPCAEVDFSQLLTKSIEEDFPLDLGLGNGLLGAEGAPLLLDPVPCQDSLARVDPNRELLEQASLAPLPPAIEGLSFPPEDNSATVPIATPPTATTTTTTTKPAAAAAREEPKKRRKRKPCPLANVADTDLAPEQLAKRQQRRAKNKESAQQSRLRKKEQLSNLSLQVASLTAQNSELSRKLEEALKENELLRQQQQQQQVAREQQEQFHQQSQQSQFQQPQLQLQLQSELQQPQPQLQQPQLQQPQLQQPQLQQPQLQQSQLQQAQYETSRFQLSQPTGLSFSPPTIRAATTLFAVALVCAMVTSPTTTITVPTTTTSPTRHLADTHNDDLIDAPTTEPQQPVTTTNAIAPVIVAPRINSAKKTTRPFDSETEFDHRYGSLLPYELTDYVKHYGQPNHQYVFCTSVHSVRFDDPLDEMEFATTPRNKTHNLVVDDDANSPMVPAVVPHVMSSASPPVANDKPAESVIVLLPSGIVDVNNNDTGLDEVVCPMKMTVLRRVLTDPVVETVTF